MLHIKNLIKKNVLQKPTEVKKKSKKLTEAPDKSKKLSFDKLKEQSLKNDTCLKEKNSDKKKYVSRINEIAPSSNENGTEESFANDIENLKKVFLNEIDYLKVKVINVSLFNNIFKIYKQYYFIRSTRYLL